MDILVSSNLERLLYFMSGDTQLVAGLMEQLNTQGVYTVPEDLKTAINQEFWAGCCDDAKAQEVIARVFNQYGYLCDTHTATAWAVAEDYVNQTGDNTPMVVLSTASPAMDILVSSNLERLLYLVSGDTQLVAGLMNDLNTKGHYTVPEKLLKDIQSQFYAGCCDDAGAKAAIGRAWKLGYLCDTHTATAWAVAEDYTSKTGDKAPMVVLSTASPYKFPAAVLSSLEESDLTDEFMQMERLQALTGVAIPKNLTGLQEKKRLHNTVIPKDEMLQFVLNIER
jgi:threonine synthase